MPNGLFQAYWITWTIHRLHLLPSGARNPLEVAASHEMISIRLVRLQFRFDINCYTLHDNFSRTNDIRVCYECDARRKQDQPLQCLHKRNISFCYCYQLAWRPRCGKQNIIFEAIKFPAQQKNLFFPFLMPSTMAAVEKIRVPLWWRAASATCFNFPCRIWPHKKNTWKLKTVLL